MVVIDSNKIDEIWEKIEGPAANNDLVGTWELKELRPSPSEEPFSFPDFINYIKHVTPTHFIWIQYNDEGDEVTGAGSGTYTYSGGEYRERIEMMYPNGNPVVGGEYIFRCEIEGNRWNHFCTSFEKDNAATDTLYIDEKWARFGSM